MKYDGKGFGVMGGRFYEGFVLGAEDHLNSNVKRLFDLVRLGDFVVGNKL